MCFCEALERTKEKRKGQNLLTAISFFFPPTETWNFVLLYTFHPNPQCLVSPEREHFFTGVVSSEHLGGCWNETGFWAEHMLMLTDTQFSHSLTDTNHHWSLCEKMAIMYRTVYFSGPKFTQSQQAIRLKSLFFFDTELYMLTSPPQRFTSHL